MELKFCKNSATLSDVLDHLVRNDSEFTPKLSSRVRLGEYAKKIFTFSDRYEVFSKDYLVGLIAVYKTDQLWFITSVSVDKSQQGAGLGTRLLSALINDGGLTPPVIRLEVSATAAPAISLYRKFGFEVKNNEVDILVMERSHENEEL